MRVGTSVVAAIIALTISVGASAAIVPADPSKAALNALVDRYVGWRGGAAFQNLTSIHFEGELDTAGLQGLAAHWSSPLGSRDENTLGGVLRVSVTTAAGAWTTGPSGQVFAVPPGTTGSPDHSQAFESGHDMRGGEGTDAALAGTETLDGRTWTVLRTTYADGDRCEALLDQDTGELAVLRCTTRGQSRSTRFRDWRVVDGVRVPFDQTQISQARGPVRLKITQIELGKSPDPKLFLRPPDPHLASFQPFTHETGWIDFDVSSGELRLPVMVNGQSVEAILDSGAEQSFLDSELVAQLGLASKGDFQLNGSSAVGRAGVVTGLTLQVGGLTLNAVAAATSDMTGFAKALGHPVSLILGDETFDELIVDIDYPNHRLAFRRSDQFKAPPGAQVVPLKRDGAQRLIEVRIEGGKPAWLAVDSGDNSTLDLKPAFVAAAKLREGRPTRAWTATGLGGGETSAVLVTAHTVELADVSLSDVPIELVDAWPGATYSSLVDGRLGGGILSRFRTIFDWPHERLYLIPTTATKAPFTKDRLGVTGNWEGSEFVITAIEPQSVAAKEGLAVGQRILTVNGQPASAAWPFGEGAPGTVLQLLIRKDSTNQIETKSADGTPPVTTQTHIVIAPTRVTLADYY